MEPPRARKKVAARRDTRTARPTERGARPLVQDELVQAARRGLRRPAGAADGRPVVELLSRRALLSAARQLLREHVDRCTKCGSRFVSHEPAFVHCHYCGRMHRVANASLPAQELFELRSGMRLAS